MRIRPVSDYLERQLADFLYTDIGAEDMFLGPAGEPALVPQDGVTARIYAVPLTVYIGGITAVILELAEPRVRHGVWDHSIFPADPVKRLRRTGLAAMVTFYAAASVAEGMIEGINRRHGKVRGVTAAGEPYRADDPELLTWVQATAAFGFISAYHRYAERLSAEEWEAALVESARAAMAYGVPRPPRWPSDLDRVFGRSLHRLEGSQTLEDFLNIMDRTPILPALGEPFQPLFLRAAISLLPASVLDRLALSRRGLRPGEEALVKCVVCGSRMVRLRNHPASLQRQRLQAASPAPGAPGQ